MALELRQWQKRHRGELYNMLDRGGNKLVVDASPGSGKTPAIFDAISILEEEDPHPDRLYVHMTPRVILNVQTESDSVSFKSLLPNLPTVIFRDNQRSPVKKGDRAITITYPTFGSRASFPEWKKIFADRDTILIGDEFQFLSWDKGDGTRAGECLTECDEAGLFRRKLIYSGTLYRSDNLPVSFCDYHDDGTLKWDVHASYPEGMDEKYLRMYCGDLSHATAQLVPWDNTEPREVKISDADTKLRHFLMNPRFWTRLVHEGMTKLIDLKRMLDARCQFIIVCLDQDSAKKISEFIESNYTGLRVALAVSDEAGSVGRLKDYQNGKYDVLVTCQMAHIGFNAPWSMGIVCLSPIRARGWLDQVIARAMRVVKDIPFDQQYCWWIAPMDPLMTDFMESKEFDVNNHKAKLNRQTKDEGNGAGAKKPPVELFELRDLTVDGFISVGNSADEPIRTFEERETVRAIQEVDDSLKSVPPTLIAQIMRAVNRVQNPVVTPTSNPTTEDNPYAGMSTRDREQSKRNECDKLVGRLSYIDQEEGYINPGTEAIGKRKTEYWSKLIPRWRGMAFKNLKNFEENELDGLIVLLRKKVAETEASRGRGRNQTI